MSFQDLIGFIISFGVFVFLMIRSAIKKSSIEDMEEDEYQPPPIPKKQKRMKLPESKPLPKQNTYQDSSIISHHFHQFKDSKYEVIGKAQVSRGNKLIAGLKSKKDMIILNEILGRPKGFR